MRKLYVYLGMIAGLLFTFVLGTQAQKPILKAEPGKTFYAGIASDPTGYFGTTNQGGIASFDINAPYAEPLNHMVKQNDMIVAGAMVEEGPSRKYYAMFVDQTGNPTNFCTVNFTAGTTKVLGKASKLMTMFYDATQKVMYGITQTETASKLYIVDTTNGNLTEKAEFPNIKVVAAGMNGNYMYAITVDGHLCVLFPDENPVRVNDLGKIRNGKLATPEYCIPDNLGQSLVNEGNNLYWLGSGRIGSSTTSTCFLATINTIAKEFNKIGETTGSFANGKVQLTGLCFNTTNEQEAVDDPANNFYAGVTSDLTGSVGGGIVTFNKESPYVNLTHFTEQDDMIVAGTTVGGTYYAMCADEFGTEVTNFTATNLETCEVKVLGKATMMYDMAYDPQSKIMYGMNQDDSGSTIYSIDLANGAVTQICKYKDLFFVAMTIAKDGIVYALADDSNLYTLKLSDISATAIMKVSFGPDYAGHQSLAFHNETLYWLGYGYVNPESPTAFLATIDMVAKTTTQVGTGKFKCQLAGLGFAPKATGKAATKLITIKTFGDVLGTIPADQCSIVETFYYDENNNLLRSSLRGYRANDPTILDPMKYYVYEYNDKNLLVKSYYRQYGQYDGLYNIYSEPKGFNYYEYDSNGRITLLNDETTLSKISYEWDGDNLIKETKSYLRNGTKDDWYTMSEFIYSDFLPNAKNCPLKMESDGAYDSYKYAGVYTYDDNNNKTSFTTYKFDDSKKGKEEWKYNEDGKLIEHIKYEVKNDDFVAAGRTTYTIDGNDTKVVAEGGMTYKIRTEAECLPETAPLNFRIEDISTPNSANTFKLSCDIPTSQTITNPAWDIYRDGMKISRVKATDGTITYTDQEVSNGMHDYFIQTVSEDGMTYNISTGVTKDLKTELAPVTDVKGVMYEKVAASEDLNVTISWTAPVSTYIVEGYNLYLGASKMPTNTVLQGADIIHTLITGTETVVNFGPAEYPNTWIQNVTIEAVYATGRIKTAPVSINVNDLPDYASINESEMTPVIEINGNELLINGEYQLLNMYNVNGTLVKTANGISNIDISSLSTGMYMIRIDNNGKLCTVKVIKK